MNIKLTLLALLSGMAMAVAADKPVIYNNLPGPDEPVNPRAREIEPLLFGALAANFTIVDLPFTPDYVGPKVTAGSLPRVAKDPDGKSMGGQVVVGYVITSDGRAGSPVILKTSDERLNSVATKAMEGWRFQPATLKGAAISTPAAQDFTFEATPTEFIQQVLEPTGGKIARPKDWFYVEGHRGASYRWTISREDTAGGDKPYDTGVRIQWFAKIKEGAGKSARQFILDFIADKKKEADKVIETCEPKDQGLFTRVCLETEEGPYHILYSLFWGSNDLDMAVVSIAGTPKELWETYEPAFQKMGSFELIDMKRHEK